MGKINCSSSKLKFEEQINKKNINDYEKGVIDEYYLLRNLSEGKAKSSGIDLFFVLTNYKKKLSRLQKWINIAYMEIPEEEQQIILEKRKQIYNDEDLKLMEGFQLEKINNFRDDINQSRSLDSSVNIINNNEALKDINNPMSNSHRKIDSSTSKLKLGGNSYNDSKASRTNDKIIKDNIYNDECNKLLLREQSEIEYLLDQQDIQFNEDNKNRQIGRNPFTKVNIVQQHTVKVFRTYPEDYMEASSIILNKLLPKIRKTSIGKKKDSIFDLFEVFSNKLTGKQQTKLSFKDNKIQLPIHTKKQSSAYGNQDLDDDYYHPGKARHYNSENNSIKNTDANTQTNNNTNYFINNTNNLINQGNQGNLNSNNNTKTKPSLKDQELPRNLKLLNKTETPKRKKKFVSLYKVIKRASNSNLRLDNYSSYLKSEFSQKKSLNLSRKNSAFNKDQIESNNNNNKRIFSKDNSVSDLNKIMNSLNSKDKSTDGNGNKLKRQIISGNLPKYCQPLAFNDSKNCHQQFLFNANNLKNTTDDIAFSNSNNNSQSYNNLYYNLNNFNKGTNNNKRSAFSGSDNFKDKYKENERDSTHKNISNFDNNKNRFFYANYNINNNSNKSIQNNFADNGFTNNINNNNNNNNNKKTSDLNTFNKSAYPAKTKDKDKENYTNNNNNLNLNNNFNNNQISNLSNNPGLLGSGKKTNNMLSQTSDTVEHNFRKFFKSNKEKLFEKVLKGPPFCFRWICWMIIIGIPNERSLQYFNNCLYSNINLEIEIQIKKDLARTLPLHITQTLSIKELTDKEYSLYKILRAFAANDPEVSYCQGMNYIASFLLQITNFEELETFYMLMSLFSNTFYDKLGIRGFYTSGFSLLNFYLFLFHHEFKDRLPKLYKHLIVNLELSDDAWISKWFMTLFTMTFPMEVVARIWDSLIVRGLDFLVSFAIALLEELERKLLKFDDPFDVVDFFKTLSPFESNYMEKLVNTTEYCADVMNTDRNKSSLKIVSTEINQHINSSNLSQIEIHQCSTHKRSLPLSSSKPLKPQRFSMDFMQLDNTNFNNINNTNTNPNNTKHNKLIDNEQCLQSTLNTPMNAKRKEKQENFDNNNKNNNNDSKTTTNLMNISGVIGTNNNININSNNKTSNTKNIENEIPNANNASVNCFSGNKSTSKQQQSTIEKINIENLINTALKIKISEVTILNLKKQFENQNNISLSIITKKYDLNKTIQNSIIDEDFRSSSINNQECNNYIQNKLRSNTQINNKAININNNVFSEIGVNDQIPVTKESNSHWKTKSSKDVKTEIITNPIKNKNTNININNNNINNNNSNNNNNNINSSNNNNNISNNNNNNINNNNSSLIRTSNINISRKSLLKDSNDNKTKPKQDSTSKMDLSPLIINDNNNNVLNSPAFRFSVKNSNNNNILGTDLFSPNKLNLDSPATENIIPSDKNFIIARVNPSQSNDLGKIFSKSKSKGNTETIKVSSNNNNNQFLKMISSNFMNSETQGLGTIKNKNNQKSNSLLNNHHQIIKDTSNLISSVSAGVSNISNANESSSLIEDCQVENELDNDCIDSKIEMYKFNFNNKTIKKQKVPLILKKGENSADNKKQ